MQLFARGISARRAPMTHTHASRASRKARITLALFAMLVTTPTWLSAATPDPNSKPPKTDQSKQQTNGASTTQTGPGNIPSKLEVPDISAARNQAIQDATQPGGSGNNTAAGNTAADSARSQAGDLPSTKTGTGPAFDSGFRDKPTSVSGAGNLNSNPMSSDTACAGGLVGAAGCAQQGSKGPAGMGTSLISQDANPGGAGVGLFVEGGGTLVQGSGKNVDKDGNVKPIGNGTPVQNPFAGQGDPNVRAGVKGDVNNRQQQMDSALCDQGDQAACNRQKASQAQAQQTPPAQTGNAGDPVVTHPSGNTTTYNKDGSVTHRQNATDGSYGYTDTTVTKTKNADGTTTTTVTQQKFDGNGQKVGGATTTSSTVTPCDPSICGSSAESIAKFYAANPGLLAQLAQSRGTDSGNIDPGRGDSTPFTVDSGAAAPVSGAGAIGLTGNPGQRGGLGDHGSINTSTNFGSSRGAGAINPGPDGGMSTTGGRTEDIDDRINGQPQRDLPANTSAGSSSSTSGSPVAAPRTPGSQPPRVQVKCTPNHPIPAFRCP